MTSPSVAERFDLGGYLRAEAARVDRALALAMEKAGALLSEDVQAAARHGVLSGGSASGPCSVRHRVPRVWG